MQPSAQGKAAQNELKPRLPLFFVSFFVVFAMLPCYFSNAFQHYLRTYMFDFRPQNLAVHLTICVESKVENNTSEILEPDARFVLSRLFTRRFNDSFALPPLP